MKNFTGHNNINNPKQGSPSGNNIGNTPIGPSSTSNTSQTNGANSQNMLSNTPNSNNTTNNNQGNAQTANQPQNGTQSPNQANNSGLTPLQQRIIAKAQANAQKLTGQNPSNQQTPQNQTQPNAQTGNAANPAQTAPGQEFYFAFVKPHQTTDERIIYIVDKTYFDVYGKLRDDFMAMFPVVSVVFANHGVLTLTDGVFFANDFSDDNTNIIQDFMSRNITIITNTQIIPTSSLTTTPPQPAPPILNTQTQTPVQQPTQTPNQPQTQQSSSPVGNTSVPQQTQPQTPAQSVPMVDVYYAITGSGADTQIDIVPADYYNQYNCCYDDTIDDLIPVFTSAAALIQMYEDAECLFSLDTNKTSEQQMVQHFAQYNINMIHDTDFQNFIDSCGLDDDEII